VLHYLDEGVFLNIDPPADGTGGYIFFCFDLFQFDGDVFDFLFVLFRLFFNELHHFMVDIFPVVKHVFSFHEYLLIILFVVLLKAGDGYLYASVLFLVRSFAVDAPISFGVVVFRVFALPLAN
jgi:hypothetical protein